MTKDEIEKWAREAGFMYFNRFDGQLFAGDEDGSLTLFAELVAAAERERCAKLCDTEWNGDSDTYEAANAYNECAEAIRALK